MAKPLAPPPFLILVIIINFLGLFNTILVNCVSQDNQNNIGHFTTSQLNKDESTLTKLSESESTVSLNKKHDGGPSPRLPAYQIYYAWKKAEFKFKSSGDRKKMIKSKQFIQSNVILSAIKIYRRRMFLTTPRYKAGVPSTLNVVPYSCNYYAPYEHHRYNPVLTPWPSWEMQAESNCSALQLVQSMEIDQFGRMWVVDVGRTSILETKPVHRCPPKLLIIDLKRGRDKIVMSYEFPKKVVSPTTNILKDINVACTSKINCFAYIVDIADNKLIVFDHKRKQSWALRHKSMKPDPARTNFTINGKEPASIHFGITGSALSPIRHNFDTFFYSPMASTAVYSVPTSVLQKPAKNRKLKNKDVTDLGLRSGQSDGWAMDGIGNLYFGNLPQSAVYQTKIERNMTRLGRLERRAQSAKDLSWPDTFAFDNYGMMTVTSNKFQLYGTPQMKPNEINFRVLRFLTKTSGYNRSNRLICRPKTCKSCG